MSMKSMKFSHQKAFCEFNKTFELKRLNDLQNSQINLVVVPLSKQTKINKKKQNYGKQELQYPKWNDDGLCYTPSFIIPQDQLLYEKIKDTLKQGFFDQIQRNSQESSVVFSMNIWSPYPQDQNYCGVCKIQYMNFQQHTSSSAHKQKCLKSSYTQHIHQLCKDVSNFSQFKHPTQQNHLNKFKELNQTQNSYFALRIYQSKQNSLNNLSLIHGKELNQLTTDQNNLLLEEPILCKKKPMNYY